jgi:hypothetical protein
MSAYALVALSAMALFPALCMYNCSRRGVQVRLMQRLALCLPVITFIHFGRRVELLLPHWRVAFQATVLKASYENSVLILHLYKENLLTRCMQVYH